MHEFYSDTQTRPSRAMREAILDVETGDERLGADPTTNRLCERVAEMLGMEAAVFLPSGTMCNQIAIAVYCRPGDEVVCARESHIIFAESGAPAALSGVMVNPIDCDRGIMSAEQVRAHVRPVREQAPRSRLLIAEQTSNLGGGAIWPAETLKAVASAARDAGLFTHLDGARILNASVASGAPPSVYTEGYYSAWMAFTKGLGCPVGAVLAGSRDFIEEAWAIKRRWGGAMRQSGVLAAMCLYALDNNVERLAEDHELARYIGERIAETPFVASVAPVETNIVLVNLKENALPAPSLADHLREHGVSVTVVGRNRIRIVTHMDVNREGADELLRAFAATPAV